MPQLPNLEQPFAETNGIKAQRRNITVLFFDMVGSSALSTRLDPEDLREVLRTFQTCCENAVHSFDGHIARYMGDGILAYFGFPAAHEDDAERAVEAALEATKAVAKLSFPGATRIEMRIGIATGLVVVGDLIGEGPSREFALIGEAPNLAARLQQIAKPNQILVAPTTRRLLGQLFEFTDLGEQEIKGHSERVRVSAVLRNSGASRFEARQSVRRAPLIGRDLELTLVRPAIQYWLKAGQQASKRSAFMEAITHFQSALKLLEELPEDKERFELEIQIQQSFAAASMAAKGFGAEATVHALNRALKLCHRLNAPQQIFPVLSGLIGAHLMRGKIESARELAQDLLNLAQNRNDRTALLMGHRYSRSANSPRRSANYKTQ